MLHNIISTHNWTKHYHYKIIFENSTIILHRNATVTTLNLVCNIISDDKMDNTLSTDTIRKQFDNMYHLKMINKHVTVTVTKEALSNIEMKRQL